MLKRNLQHTITHLLQEYPSIAVLGPRQVGKTTLVKKIAKQQKKKTLYLDLEKEIDIRKLTDAESFFDLYKDQCIILDEVQTIPKLFTILRPAIDEYRKPNRFILLGSASPELVAGVSETLAGRIAYIELTPLGLLELPKRISQRKHWFRGGFPKALLAKTDGWYIQWMDDFIRSYIERDLTLIFGVQFSANIMRNFWTMLAHANGNIWNAETFARSLGITSVTVNKYTDYLEAAFIIHRLPAFFINAKKRLVKAPKVYIRDSGLLHRLVNIQNTLDLQGNAVVGASWEGYVIEQIYRCLETHGWNMYFYRTQVGAEVDLILISPSGKMSCIEIKSTNNPKISKGFYQSVTDLKPNFQYVITPTAEKIISVEGVVICSLLGFLKHEIRNIL